MGDAWHEWGDSRHRLVRPTVMVRRPPPGEIPDAPGSYQFLDLSGRVLYVGKAKSLRSRLNSYFADPSGLGVRTRQMLEAEERVERIQVGNEVEALMLECSLIKEHRPRFNVRLMDDKSYPWVAVTSADPWPRVAVVRGARRRGVRYFGPYASAAAIRETIDLLIRTYPVRSCTDAKFGRHRRLGSPCLLAHIERCSAPCVGAIGEDAYGELVEGLTRFLRGETGPLVEHLEAAMAAAAAEQRFELAARLRDQLGALRASIDHQGMVGDSFEDLDAIGMAEDELLASVCLLSVRHGRVVGRRSLFVEKVEEIDQAQLVGRIIEELYGSSRSPASVSRGDRWASGSSRAQPAAPGPGQVEVEVPRSVLVATMPVDQEIYRQFLASRRGGAVRLAVPKRGARRDLLSTAERNAAEDLTRQRTRRFADHDARSRALHALGQALGLERAPLRIECYDMSHLQGTSYVGSMVVLEDGLPKPSEYRRFQVRSVQGNDDYAAMEEVLTRRLGHLVDSRHASRPGRLGALPVSGDPAGDAEGAGRKAGRFSYPPELLLLDGSKGQLAVGTRVLEQLGLAGSIPIAALAKRLEEVFVPGRPDPVELPRGSDALYLLQQIRDEAHRFAIGYHRKLRSKSMTRGVLDDVPGLGPRRQARLVRELGSLKRVRAASFEELEALGWLPSGVAGALYDRLHPGADRGKDGAR